MAIKIDYKRDGLLTEQAADLVRQFYRQAGDQSPQDAYARMALCYSMGDHAFAQRIYDYISKGWFMAASPVLSNAVDEGQPMRGLPISCFLTFAGDNLHSLVNHQSELAWLTLKGGGVGGHWSTIRAVSDKGVGVVPLLKVADGAMTAYKQGKTRKGAYAAYLDISHPDVMEFIEIRVPTGGDVNRKCLNIHNAVNLSDDFMQAVLLDRSWSFVCPHSKETRNQMPARRVWEKLLETRARTGEPYLNFIDTANRHLPEALKLAGLKIHGSNLCNEIHLPTDEERTAVCCLSSVNLEAWPHWRKTNMIRDLIRFLDNVLTVFIQNAPDELAKARYSAHRSRDLGLGAMGFHGLLQSMGVAFESEAAQALNQMIFSEMREQADLETVAMAYDRGAAPDLADAGVMRRNAHLLAIAPNANSSIIAGCSPSIEPIKSNAYVHNTRAGTHTVRNRHLIPYLEAVGLNTPEVWRSIVAAGGSVQHLEGLAPDVKAIFKTAFELDQRWVVQHAADRQPHICQGQSVNVFFPAGASREYVNSVHLLAYLLGLKGLYYFRTEALTKPDQVGQKVERVLLNAPKPEESACLACEA